MSGPQRIVITGGPGSGKSTLIDALERKGYPRSIEAGRAIIRDQVAIGGSALPWSDPSAFAELMLAWEMRSYQMVRDHAGPVFFDRGVPDVAGYLHLTGLPVPAHVDRAATLFRYDRRVFLAPHWPEIFEQDAERKQTSEEAEKTCEVMAETYARHGYDLVILPFAPVTERLEFVLDRIRPFETASHGD